MFAFLCFIYSYLHEAVELLRSPRLLSDTTAAAAVGKAATTVYMEAVCNISSHGANKLDLSDLQGCSGASCVDRIIVHTSINATANENATAILSSLVPSSSEIAGSKVEYRPTAAAGGGGSAEQSTNTDTDGTTRFIPNSLLNILSSVQPHATAEGIIVLLLVTKGYADMLTNFLCSAHKIHFRHFLILTHDQEIQDIAREFNVNFYTPHSSFEDVPTDADFGTVQYQSLVFSRTELAMELLLSGFQPIIADVDTVWLSNPLEHLPWSPAAAGSDADGSTGAETGAAAGAGTGAAEDGLQYDVAITDDNGEVCGCFIALRNTDNAVRFWNEVYVAHRALIATALSSGNIKAFDESEQKIVTQLIYRGQYKSTLLVLQLPAEIFPSGYAYFNTQTHRVQNNQPAVVHNNFIVGRGLKKARFQRYGMWSSLKPAPDRADSSDLCESDVAVATYLKFFASASRNISIPSLNMYLPVHNGAVGDLSSMMVHISAEGPVRVRHNGATSDFTFPSSKVYVDNNPPSFMEGNTVVFAVLNMSANVNYSSLSLTVTTNSESVALSADVASFQDSFATDREGRFHDLATEVVLRNQRELREAAVTSADALTGAREGYSDGLPLPYKSASAIGGDNSYEEEHPTRSTEEEVALSGEARPSSANRNPDPIAPAPPVSSPVPAAPVPAMSYSIRVITYKRAASLRRLLTSLASAEYMSYNNISLYISVDYPRDEQVF